MAKILSVGYSRKRVLERTRVLRRAGYEVIATTDAAMAELLAASADLDLLVLGSTLGTAERNRIAARARAHNPQVRIVMLYQGSIEHAELADALLGQLQPEALVEAVRLLLADDQQQAQRSGAV
jgi:DNA-binding response OmpR family regulator